MQQGHKEKNFAILEKQTREAGFAEDMVRKLRDHVLNDQSYAFYIISALELMERRAFASLYYERPMLVAPYRFQSFNLSITGDRKPPIHENQFMLGNGYDVTLGEAMNLIEGRMVFRQPALPGEARDGAFGVGQEKKVRLVVQSHSNSISISKHQLRFNMRVWDNHSTSSVAAIN